MDDMNPNARALLNAARSFDDPTDYDHDRVRAAVLMRVGSVAAIGTVAITAAKASSAAASAGPLLATGLTSTALFGGVAAKFGAVVVIGAIASGAYVAFRAPHHTAVIAQASTAKAAPVAFAAVEPAEVPPAPVAVQAAELPSEDVKVSPARVLRRATDLEGEMKLLRQADAALRHGDATGALAALNKHATQYPAGVLSQEREGVRAIALCSSGNLGQGQSAAARFLNQASKSPLASRIRSACSLKE